MDPIMGMEKLVGNVSGTVHLAIFETDQVLSLPSKATLVKVVYVGNCYVE